LAWKLTLLQGSWVRLATAGHSLVGTLYFAMYASTAGSVVIGMITRLEVEDLTLRAHFGKEWEEWADIARWKLLPGVY